MKKPLPLWQIWLIAALVTFALAAVDSDDDGAPVVRAAAPRQI
ncbi:hypothetical protein J2794_001665 [Paraburkholderia terricola]|nr:hypothetical protein [Paraburkholderia terricola]MDR6445574.1 hypothetical protein [Paraburkholderia terricola]